MRKHWGIVLILLIAAFLRFYNLNQWLVWGMDQEYEAFIVKNIVSFRHFPLIGVNASDTGMYLGSFFIYFATIPFLLFGGNPIGWAATASLAGVVVCFLIYKIGKAMFSESAGYFAALLYAFSFLAAYYDRQFWNPTLVPFFSLLIGYLLFRILEGESNKLIPLALVFGLSIQTHLSVFVFLPIILYVLWLKRHKFTRRVVLLSLIVLTLTQTPLILFELRHGFLNTKAAFGLIKRFNASERGVLLSERTSLLVSTLGRFAWLPPAPDLYVETGKCLDYFPFRKNPYTDAMLLVSAGLVFFFWHHIRQKTNSPYKNSVTLLTGIVLMTVLIVFLYSFRIYEYYFLYFLPWLAIILGWVISFLWKKKMGKMVLSGLIMIMISLNLLTFFTAKMSYSYHDKMRIVEFVRQNLNAEPFALEALGECPRFGGYRYLFSLKNLVPQKSYMDSYFSWLYSYDLSEEKPRKTVLLSLIDSRDKPEKIARWQENKLQFLSQSKISVEARFGNIQAFILE